MPYKVLLFAGTSEGRLIAQNLTGKMLQLDISVATPYAAELLPSSENVRIFSQRLDKEQMTALLKEGHYDLVLDATHPFARNVSDNIRNACLAEKTPLIRVLRETEDRSIEGEASVSRQDSSSEIIKYVSDTTEARSLLSLSDGPVFLTTGSQTIKDFMQIPQAKDRIFARILPVPDALQQALSYGLAGNHITCAQGPFSADENLAVLKRIRSVWQKEHPGHAQALLTLVTKESGRPGGFQEKIDAARQASAACIVIRRPEESIPSKIDADMQSMTLAQTLSFLDARLSEITAENKPAREVFLIGCGMSAYQLTLEADHAIQTCDILIGADRLLRMTEHYHKESFRSYDPVQITKFLQEHPQYKRAAILFSGDIGFYSGASRLRECLASCPDILVKPISGISSPVHFLNTLGKSYEDVLILSMHGRTPSVLSHLRTHEKLLLLLGKEDDAAKLCHALYEQGMKDVDLTIGSCLRSPRESIVKGKPADFLDRVFDPLSVLYLENPAAADEPVLHGLPDGAFRRSSSPMTKSEVRSVILSKLQLTGKAVFYDIGAGTGSIAVEAARMIPDGKVYAIEKNSDAISTILYNGAALHADNMYAVPGMAPEILEALPSPTHVFIGGSSGKIQEILQAVLQKNPFVKIAASAITLETLSALLGAQKELSLPEPEIIQIQVTHTKKAGSSHMMQAQNPVFIVVFPALNHHS